MYLSSGRGRKSGGARATGATPSLAPLLLQKNSGNSSQLLYPGYDVVPKLQTKEESQESYDYETPISTSTTYIDVVQ